MIRITENIFINENEIKEEFVRSSGPGGQNVNKVSTAVQLRFDVINSSLPQNVKERLIKISGKKTTAEGILIIDARKFRSQEKNREDALQRLILLIEKATHEPKKRIKTKPSKVAKEKRLSDKKRKSEIKSFRRNKDYLK